MVCSLCVPFLSCLRTKGVPLCPLWDKGPLCPKAAPFVLWYLFHLHGDGCFLFHHHGHSCFLFHCYGHCVVSLTHVLPHSTPMLPFYRLVYIDWARTVVGLHQTYSPPQVTCSSLFSYNIRLTVLPSVSTLNRLWAQPSKAAPSHTPCSQLLPHS